MHHETPDFEPAARTSPPVNLQLASSGTAQSWWRTARRWLQSTDPARRGPRIGVALGGGFARGIAHIGVLRVLRREGIPIYAIAGVSSGSMVAAAYASGRSPDEIEAIARSMRFRDVARWTLNRLGLACSDRMEAFLQRLLATNRFENMRLPLAVVATNLNTGKAAIFKERGDVVLPIRASCAYPGLFMPIRHQQAYLVDGNISMEVPAPALRGMGATHVISVHLPSPESAVDPGSMLSVINRCFQILTGKTETEWRRASSLVITPNVASMGWDSFESCADLIRAGEQAAMAALPRICRWLESTHPPSVSVTRSTAQAILPCR